MYLFEGCGCPRWMVKYHATVPAVRMFRSGPPIAYLVLGLHMTNELLRQSMRKFIIGYPACWFITAWAFSLEPRPSHRPASGRETRACTALKGGKYARGCRIRKTGESQPCASYIHKAGVTAYLQSRSKVNAWDWWWTRPGNISETRAREPDADP